MVFEIFESQAEADPSGVADNAAELVHIGGLAVSGQAHDFVFVAEFAKSQILRHGRVIHAERMGKRNRPVDVHSIALAGAPHGAGEIAEPVRGQQRGLVERRNEKRARQVRLVVLDAVILGSNLAPARHRMPSPALPESPRTGPSLLFFRWQNSASSGRTGALSRGAPRDCAGWRCGQLHEA